MHLMLIKNRPKGRVLATGIITTHLLIVATVIGASFELAL